MTSSSRNCKSIPNHLKTLSRFVCSWADIFFNFLPFYLSSFLPVFSTIFHFSYLTFFSLHIYLFLPPSRPSYCLFCSSNLAFLILLFTVLTRFNFSFVPTPFYVSLLCVFLNYFCAFCCCFYLKYFLQFSFLTFCILLFFFSS